MIQRTLAGPLEHHLARGKSVLLLGPRQTGKTTLLASVAADLRVSLVEPRARQRYEKDPSLLNAEILALGKKRPLVIVDEVQRVPDLMDVFQHLIDQRVAQLILTGSSARRLKRGHATNLLPGRVVSLRLDPLTLGEHFPRSLQDLLTQGALPAVRLEEHERDRDEDLRSYVETYLEEEVRQEALVRKMAPFGRFLELAALESGQVTNFAAIAQDIGVSAPTVAQYYEILVDCLVAERIEPITRSRTRKRLTKSAKHLFFDLGVRREAAGEGSRLGPVRLGELFEQAVALELIRVCRLYHPAARVRFWRDPEGPEVDWVLEHQGAFVPIEVKWTDHPKGGDAKHLMTFMAEYPEARRAFVVCRTPRAMTLADNVTALPWEVLRQPENPILAALSGR
jgi:predicted AAA+ superfamily ATPase